MAINIKRVIVCLVRKTIERRKSLVMDYNENHDLTTGQFASGGGSGNKTTSNNQGKRDIIKPMGINFRLDLFGVDYSKMKKSEIQKSVNSLQKRIKEHENKISNPKRYDKTWEQRDERYKSGTIKHWNTEIKSLTKQKEEAEEYLRGRRRK